MRLVRLKSLGVSPATSATIRVLEEKLKVALGDPTLPSGKARANRGRLTLSARSLKITLVLDPAQLAAAAATLPAVAGPREFVVEVAGRRVSGRLNPKTLRRVLAMIGEHGPDEVPVIIQGKLEPGDGVGEAGIMAQVKTPRNG